MSRHLYVISALVVIASCGGGESVTKPTLIASAITITSSNTYLMPGQTEAFTASLVFPNGTTQALTDGSWGTDATAVATVGSSTGLVTAVTAGDVTIFVHAYGLRGTKRIAVVPDYQGNWTGRYLLTDCTETGQWASIWNLCSNLADGSRIPVTLNLSQTGGTVTGQIDLMAFGVPEWLTTLTTTAVAGGGLVFQATHQSLATQVTQDWQLNIQAGQLTGSVVQTATDTGLSGNLVIKGTLLTMTKK